MSGELKDKTIILGVTGGISAYKACELSRMMMKEGAEVKVVMTENAKKFVSHIRWYYARFGVPMLHNSHDQKHQKPLFLAKFVHYPLC